MSVNITGTEMVSLALRTQASLLRSRLDVHVLPPDKYANPDAKEQANQEERMYYHGFKEADNYLFSIGEAGLLSSMTWQAIVLGRVCVRVLILKKDKNIKWRLLPMNPRFVTFAFDDKGLAWVNYETFRSADSIYNEYKVEVDDEHGKGVSVNDYWDREHNVRFLTKGKTRLGKTWKHPFKEVPAIIAPVAIGPKAAKPEGLEVTTWGQSVFDHVKSQFEKLNRMRSIAATHAHLLAKLPLDVAYDDGQEPILDESHMEFYPGAMYKHPRSVDVKSMDVKDIPQSLAAIISDLQTGIEKATFAELNPDKPAHSGSALRILGQDKQDVITPRAQTINNTYTAICHMLKRQILIQKLTIPVKTVKGKSYDVFDIKPGLLDNDFYVNAELIRRDVYDEVEALQRAQLLLQNRFMCREDILERVLNEPDSKTQLTKIDIEDVETAVPELKLKRAIQLYHEAGMIEEARMAEEQLAMLEIQKQQALMQGVPQEEPQMGQAPVERGSV